MIDEVLEGLDADLEVVRVLAEEREKFFVLGERA